MKKAFTLVLIAGITMLAGTTAKANNICFLDGFGEQWRINYSSDGNGHYYGTGTVDVGTGFLWNVTMWAQSANLTGSVELHAVNPQADGCNSYSDSFIFIGTCQIFRSGGHTTSWNGSGSWNSYCFGGVLNTGTWDASGPSCNFTKSVKINPNGPTSHVSTTAFKASNTICFIDGFGEKWIVTYSPNGDGSYSGRGTVDIGGGILWNVNFSAEFANLTGTVELHASNPSPDNCTSYSDSFVFVGTGNIVRSGGHTVSWTASGSWNSYCFGGVLNAGTWDASGPSCGTGKALKVDPNGPATHGSRISVVVAPNPANNHAAISFKLAKQSQVQVTVFNYLQQPVKLLANGSLSAGKQNYSWDLRDTNGKIVSNGLYRVVTIVDGKSYSTMIQVVR